MKYHLKSPNSGQGRKSPLRWFVRILSIYAVVVFANALFAGGCLMLAIALFDSGCSQKSSTTFSSEANQEVGNTNPAAVTAPSAQPVPGTASVVQTDGQPDMAELNRVAKFWMFRNRRRPTSWDDFVANAGVQIPPPPPGKKYVLSQDTRVTLENR
ncbi:MAG TPA: hypothetical protein VNU95_03150 [Candidatus Acidoferrales bacterium]|jgi:hypothetical protein|nr:hypothetical protein [Candidatus Acidoferrales bacterium]